MADVTHILEAIEEGDPTAAEQLLPVVYDDLRRLAARKLASEKPGQTLQPTALVHEVYIRLVRQIDAADFKHREHFFGAAAEVMRRILVDQAIRKRAQKRGGGAKRHELDDAQFACPCPDEKLIELNEALDELAKEAPTEAELVKLRYFVGFTLEEAAELLGISRATASRYWSFAKAFLKQQLGE